MSPDRLTEPNDFVRVEVLENLFFSRLHAKQGLISSLLTGTTDEK